MSDPGLDGFEDFEEIGRGGFSRVYKCRQRPFGRIVAVKVLHGVLGEQASSSFERECQAVGALHWHPNIITVFGAGTTNDGSPYLVMEYAPGGSLADHLSKVGAMSEAQVVAIGVKIALALQAAHDAGVLHRDVKPANILVGESGEPLLADFGVASVSGSTLTATGQISATLVHAAPEILDGKRPSVASDIYSLGSTLFNLLAGHAPFSGSDDDSAAALITRALTAPVPDLRAAGVSNATATVIEQAMARDPERRFARASDLAAALAGSSPTGPIPVGTTAAHELPANELPPPGANRTQSPGRDDVPPADDATVVIPPQPAGAATRRRVLVPIVVLVVLALAGVIAAIAASGSGSKRAHKKSPGATTRTTVTTIPGGPLITPLQERASGTAPEGHDNCGQGHDFIPARAVDGHLDTAWATTQSTKDAWLTIEFGRPVEITSIDLVPGYAREDTCGRTEDRWYQNSRIKQLRYEFSDGSVVTANFDTDEPHFQTTKIPHVVATWFRIRPTVMAPPGGPMVVGDPGGPVWPRNDLRTKIIISEIRVHGSA